MAILLLGAGILTAAVLLTRNTLIPSLRVSTTEIGQIATSMLPTVTSFISSDTPSKESFSTNTPRFPHGLETPLGLHNRFVIHTIQSGESLEFLAREYGTTMEAIRACNYLLLSPLIPGVVIVVPLNLVDLEGTPPFEAYQVMKETSMVDLVSQLDVDVEDFKYFNAFGDGTIIQANEWVLIPHSTTSSP